ncbi:keto-acid formate acetyltransferase [Escherichia coli]|nr:keto-acid formate acetyltransferase [Escherichia coli]
MALLRLPGGSEIAKWRRDVAGRTASFLDIYIERDFKAGVLNEQQAQELIDHFIMKIRMVRFLRTPEFDSLFSGDPIWATEVIGGMGLDVEPW